MIRRLRKLNATLTAVVLSLDIDLLSAYTWTLLRAPIYSEEHGRVTASSPRISHVLFALYHHL